MSTLERGTRVRLRPRPGGDVWDSMLAGRTGLVDRVEEALRRTLASAHAILRVEGGAFVSAVDPPPPLRRLVDASPGGGLWPFLVGEPGDRSTMLASPIILYDYPQVAPESPGDFFDGCEIDQLLVLSILGLSEDEKREIRGGDPRAREILERTEAMTRDDLLRLHGTWRDA